MSATSETLAQAVAALQAASTAAVAELESQAAIIAASPTDAEVATAVSQIEAVVAQLNAASAPPAPAPTEPTTTAIVTEAEPAAK